jgi:hypothetical protein
MQTRRLHQLGQRANENAREDASDDRLWVVDVGDGQMRVVQGRQALKELIASHGLPSSARAYELSAVPKTLREIPEVAAAFVAAAQAKEPAPAEAETKAQPEPEPIAPPVAAPAPAEGAPAPAEAAVAPAAAPPHNGSGSHDPDFSLLDRPFDDDDYFEDMPRRRWPRVAGVAVVALLIGGGYKLVRSRHRSTAPVAIAPAEPTAVAAAAPAPREPAASPAPPAPAPAAAPAPVAHAEPPASDPPLQSPAAAPKSQPAVEPPRAPSRASAELVAEGRRLFEAGRSRKAQALFEQALADQPDDVEALVGMGYVQLDRGKVKEAIASLERALDRDGSNARAAFGLAESYRQQGNRSAALTNFKRFLKLQPSGGDADLARRLVRDLGGGR